MCAPFCVLQSSSSGGFVAFSSRLFAFHFSLPSPLLFAFHFPFPVSRSYERQMGATQHAYQQSRALSRAVKAEKKVKSGSARLLTVFHPPLFSPPPSLPLSPSLPPPRRAALNTHNWHTGLYRRGKALSPPLFLFPALGSQQSCHLSSPPLACKKGAAQLLAASRSSAVTSQQPCTLLRVAPGHRGETYHTKRRGLREQDNC